MIGNWLREKLPPGIAKTLRLARWQARRVSAGLRFGRDDLQSSPILFGRCYTPFLRSDQLWIAVWVQS
jgi:hypothetical protein